MVKRTIKITKLHVALLVFLLSLLIPVTGYYVWLHQTPRIPSAVQKIKQESGDLGGFGGLIVCKKGFRTVYGVVQGNGFVSTITYYSANGRKLGSSYHSDGGGNAPSSEDVTLFDDREYTCTDAE